ncbi:MAG: gluconokinase [Planctomycetota bacterium]
MGVSGCGKSTLAIRLADRLGLTFLEGDAFHSEENRKKMGGGVPLTDTDRAPWVSAMCAAISDSSELEVGGCVLACSALRKEHRQRLTSAGIELFLHVTGDPEIIRTRLRAREQSGHFMKASMLESQLEALELPKSDERVIDIDVAADPETQLRRAIEIVQQEMNNRSDR